MNLAIGKTASGGTLYAMNGCIPFNFIDLNDLKYGDAVRDNNGKGMFMSVNICSNCGARYLASTLILCLEAGPCCMRKL